MLYELLYFKFVWEEGAFVRVCLKFRFLGVAGADALYVMFIHGAHIVSCSSDPNCLKILLDLLMCGHSLLYLITASKLS